MARDSLPVCKKWGRAKYEPGAVTSPPIRYVLSQWLLAHDRIQQEMLVAGRTARRSSVLAAGIRSLTECLCQSR